MENKITVSGLAAMIALASGQPGQLCEDFLRELFSIIADELAKGENVRIKGLGTFKVADIEARKSVDVTTGEEIEIAAHRKVTFVASKELAALVNAPFEAFEAVEVSDALPTDELLDVAEIVGPENLTDESGDLLDASEGLNVSETVGPVIINSEISLVEKQESTNESALSLAEIAGSNIPNDEDDLEENEESGSPVISFSSSLTSRATRREDISDNDPGELDDDEKAANKESIRTIHFESDESDEDEEEESERPRGRFWSGFMTGFLSAIALIALVMLIGVKFDMVPEKVSNMLTKTSQVGEKAENDLPFSSAILSDSAIADDSTDVVDENEAREDAVPTMASDEPVYDVVSTTRYLTTMAKEHYGNFNLWPIIYEENQAFLGHPDRIKPGTQVVIPPLSKYKIDPDNPDDVNRIKQKGVSIYAKYK